MLTVMWSVKGQDIPNKLNQVKNRLNGSAFKFSGLIQASGQIYTASGLSVERGAPFNGQLFATLNIDFYGIKTPLSLLMNSGGVVFGYKLPSFAYVGLSPAYKWARLHIGNRNMNMGKYSFSNHSFNGIGVELSPQKWRFNTFYGRLRRAQPEDFNSIQRIDPFYKRVGWGIQGGYSDGPDELLVSLFHAKDDVQSIPGPQQEGIFPGENAIITLNGKKQINEIIDVQFELSRSVYTADQAAIGRNVSANWFRRLGGLIDLNSSSRWSNAWQTTLYCNHKIARFNISIEHIDPGYRTLGALFFQDDQENISGGAQFTAFRQKLQTNINAGYQRNNLDHDQIDAYDRLIGSLHMIFQINPKWNVQFQYSNFSNSTKVQLLAEPAIPFSLTELALTNSQILMGMHRQFGQKTPSLLHISYNLQNNKTISNEMVGDQTYKISIANCTYSIQFPHRKLQVFANAALLTNDFDISIQSQQNVVLGLRKQFFKNKINISASLGPAFHRLENATGTTKNTLTTAQLTLQYQINQQYQLHSTTQYFNNQGAINPFTEFRTHLQMSMRF